MRQEQDKKDIVNTMKILLDEKIDPIVADLQQTKKGIQILLRDSLEQKFEKHEKDGYCGSEDKERFESMYQAYHNLGKNGVMDTKRQKVLNLPERKAVKEKSKKNSVKVLNE